MRIRIRCVRQPTKLERRRARSRNAAFVRGFSKIMWPNKESVLEGAFTEHLFPAMFEPPSEHDGLIPRSLFEDPR